MLLHGKDILNVDVDQYNLDERNLPENCKVVEEFVEDDELFPISQANSLPQKHQQLQS